MLPRSSVAGAGYIRSRSQNEQFRRKRSLLQSPVSRPGRPALLIDTQTAFHNSMDSMLRTRKTLDPSLYNKWTLRFLDPGYETAYRLFYLEHFTSSLQSICVAFALVQFATLGLFSQLLHDEGSWLYPVMTVNGLFFLIFYSLLSHKVLQKATHKITVLVVLLMSANLIVLQTVAARRPTISIDAHFVLHPFANLVVLLLLLSLSTFARLSFVWATTTGMLSMLILMGPSLYFGTALPTALIFYSAFVAIVAVIFFVIQSYRLEYRFRVEFISGFDLNFEKNRLEAEVAVLRTASEQVSNEEDAMVAPIEQVTDLLAKVANEPTVPRRVAEQLERIIDLLTKKKLYKPDFEQQITRGNLKVDTDTENWLFSEVSMRPSHLRRQSNAHHALQRSHSSFELNVTNESFELEEHLSQHHDYNFDVFRLVQLSRGQPLRAIFAAVCQHHNLIEELELDSTKLKNLIVAIEEGYRKDIPYHTSAHAADVVHTINHLLVNSTLSKKLTPLEKFSVILAAAIHDFNHPGFSNSYLMRSRHPLAILYNDQSPLENYHLAEAFQILYTPECNVLDHLPKEDQQTSRRLIIDLVMATDISRHFDLLSHFNSKVNVGNLDFDNPEDMTLLLQLLMKCADVSNPSKQLDLYLKWVDLVMEEFYRQGDYERMNDLPISAFMDRTKPKVAKCQANFIQFICTPIYKAVSEQLNRSDLLITSNANFEYWKNHETYDS